MGDVQKKVKSMLSKRKPKKKTQEQIFYKEKPLRKSSKTKLTDRQEKALKKHAVHHSKKHIDEMRKDMKAGKTFAAAHKAAQAKVGK